MTTKVALITGAARRVGAEIARYLHAQNTNVIIHYHRSHDEASQLAQELNLLRPASAAVLALDLNQTDQLPDLIQRAADIWGRLDVLVNNASSFYPTPIGHITHSQWDDLFASNLKAPLFLSQAAAPYLAQHSGCIVNITDIHAEKPFKDYVVYCLAKAGLAMLTKVLARELAPKIRVNAVAPGTIIWPEGVSELNATQQEKILQKIPLERQGSPLDIAKAVAFFVDDAPYITGQILAIDGGRLIL